MESPRCCRRGPMSPPAPSPRGICLAEGGGGGGGGGVPSSSSSSDSARNKRVDFVVSWELGKRERRGEEEGKLTMDVNSNHLPRRRHSPSSSSSSSSSSILRNLRQAASTEEERRVARLRERLKIVVRDLLRDGRRKKRELCRRLHFLPANTFLLELFSLSSFVPLFRTT